MFVLSTNTAGQAYWFVFYGQKLLTLLDNGKITVPLSHDLSAFNLEPAEKQYLGVLDNCPCYAVEISSKPSIPENVKFISLMRLFGLVEENLFRLAGKAFQIINWDRTHQYCSQCGAKTSKKLNEYAKVCSNCGFTVYPRISPCVIVAVLNEDKILLIRSKHFKVDFYTVISGFVESGETLEECLRREVKEEVGIEVKNISYFGSQPWPFPDSLMIAFTAEYDSGDITIDEEEIVDARWFTAGELLDLPGPISIARQLIDWFIQKNIINQASAHV